MEKIIIQEDVIDYLHELVGILYKEEYFGFEESTIKYVDRIFVFIYDELSNETHQLSNKILLKHGNYFVMYKASKRTAWYIFFNKRGNRYLITYITNNHVAKAAFLQAIKK